MWRVGGWGWVGWGGGHESEKTGEAVHRSIVRSRKHEVVKSDGTMTVCNNDKIKANT
jgi:hypothetical protein